VLQIPIKITPFALEQIKLMLTTKGLTDTYGLRIGVKGSGCSGTSFFLGFDDKKTEDSEFMEGEVKIFIEKKHFMYLLGTTLDFVEDNFQRGFTFLGNDK
jgi:iron-sulfur cluster assembly protein